MYVLIPKNTKVPCSGVTKGTTHYTNQDFLDISVYEGVNEMVAQNHLIGTFTIKGIEKAKAGEPVIVQTLNVDANGILTIEAFNEKDKKKVHKHKMTDVKGRLTNEEIEALQQQAKMIEKEQ